MGADDEQAKPGTTTDVRFNWISDRTCSSLKVKEDSFQRLLASESRQVGVFDVDSLFLTLRCSIGHVVA